MSCYKLFSDLGFQISYVCVINSHTPLYIFYLICDVICIFCLCGLDDNIFMLFLECLLLGCVWNEVIVVVGVIFGRGCGCGWGWGWGWG